MALAVTLSALCVKANDNDRLLLIINSYNEAAPWSKDMILPVTTLMAKTPGISAEMVNLYSTFIRTTEQMDTLQDRLFARYAANKPDVVVAVGNMSSIFVPRIRKEWGDVPIVHITRRLDTGNESHFLTAASGSCDDCDLTPMHRLQEQYNFTAIYVPDYYEETIDLMMRLQPKMKKFVFLADETFLNRMLNEEIEEYIRRKYPHIRYEWLVGNRQHGGDLHNYILDKDLELGMLISTWYYEHESIHGYPTMVAGDFYMLPATTSPIFSLRDSYINYGTIGGVYPEPTGVRNAIIDYVTKVINGTPARNIPFYVPSQKTVVLDYDQLAESGIDFRLVPDDAKILGAPPTFWQQYTWEIILCASILLIILALTFGAMYVQRQKVKMLKSFHRLVANMPIPYAEAHVRFYSDGSVKDLIYRITNRAYRDLIKNNHVPGNAERLFPSQEIAEKIRELLEHKKMLSFIKHFPESDTYYQFIMCQAPAKQQSLQTADNCIDIFAIDISDRIHTENELRVATEHAKESDRLKSAFLANMSHEIRTPLNAIVGFSNLLAYTDDPEKKQKYTQLIDSNNSLLLQLINDVLDLAKIESNTFDFDMQLTDINDLIHRISETVRFKVPDGVAFNVIPGLEKCVTLTDPNRLSQVVINLLTNACKFTKKGSVTLIYELSNDELYFEVRDTGRGISPEDKEKLFKRFSKIDTFSQGNGLGLSISKTIVERLGGEIGVKSRGRDKGSTFWFTIPYTTDSSTPAPRISQSERDATLSPNRRKTLSRSERPTILVADDNESNFMLLEAILSPGYNIVRACDGVEAVDLCRKHSPTVVLMDLNMPNMDGYQAAEQIRSFNPHVPIIAVTAYALSSDKERVLSNGNFNDFVPKPVDSSALTSMIGKLIHNNFILI